jgi:hypothetical protein
VQINLGILEVVVEAKLIRDRDFEGFEENTKVEVNLQSLNPEESMPIPLAWIH